MEKYKTFLGSDIAKAYDEARQFTLERVNAYANLNSSKLNKVLHCIDNYTGDVFFAIGLLDDYHSALASKSLLDNNIAGFKENAFVSGFLSILSEYDFQWAPQIARVS